MKRFSMLGLTVCSNHCLAAGTTTGGVGLAAGQTLMGLVLVIGLIFGLAWLAKRLNVGGMQGQKHMQTLAILPLGAREKAVLVDIAGQQMLLGVSPGRVTALHVFDEPVVQVITAGSGQAEAGLNRQGDFAKKLGELLRQGVKG